MATFEDVHGPDVVLAACKNLGVTAHELVKTDWQLLKKLRTRTRKKAVSIDELYKLTLALKGPVERLHKLQGALIQKHEVAGPGGGAIPVVQQFSEDQIKIIVEKGEEIADAILSKHLAAISGGD